MSDELLKTIYRELDEHQLRIEMLETHVTELLAREKPQKVDFVAYNRLGGG
jgi:hypothetical protein